MIEAAAVLCDRLCASVQNQLLFSGWRLVVKVGYSMSCDLTEISREYAVRPKPAKMRQRLFPIFPESLHLPKFGMEDSSESESGGLLEVAEMHRSLQKCSAQHVLWGGHLQMSNTVVTSSGCPPKERFQRSGLKRPQGKLANGQGWPLINDTRVLQGLAIFFNQLCSTFQNLEHNS